MAVVKASPHASAEVMSVLFVLAAISIFAVVLSVSEVVERQNVGDQISRAHARERGRRGMRERERGTVPRPRLTHTRPPAQHATRCLAPTPTPTACCHASPRHDHVITYLHGIPMEPYEYTQIARIHRTRRSGRSVNTMTSPFIYQQGMRYSDDNVLSRFVHSGS